MEEVSSMCSIADHVTLFQPIQLQHNYLTSHSPTRHSIGHFEDGYDDITIYKFGLV